MKIVITGGLGYIGTSLCELYSGEWFNEIVVVDSKFVSARVAQLRAWGIDFIQASILDVGKIANIVRDANVVIHLAGITDVAYTKTDVDPERDQLIKDTAIIGTRNILDNITKECRLVFPSTHVVYEGLQATKLDIAESDPPCPVLTYSSGKIQNEFDIITRHANAVIFRLGSVVGLSDAVRINIMPNLFAKLASQGETIKLFAGGVQMKSLVPLIDVARCLKFGAEGNIRGIFHLASENMTVGDVADICKKFVPSLKIEKTDDEVPNLGYTISNKKLLDTGFKFSRTIEDCIEEMIRVWSAKQPNPDLEHVDKGGNEFIDARGVIRNYELTEPINLIGYIKSKAGTVRANHYHPIQEQKCLLISGQYISVIKDLRSSIVETKVINPGDIAIIKPNVAHAMVFTKDSIFLNLVRGEREHQNYGVTHTIPYVLVDEDERIKLLKIYKTECRVCGNFDLDRVISLGNSPLANSLVSEDEKSETYPLEMNFCSKCFNCQLSVVIPPEKMFNNYLYMSSTSPSFVQHFEDASHQYIKEFNLTSDDLVVDIGSNDGIGILPYKKHGINILGVEPAKNLADLANSKGIPTFNGYFNFETVRCIQQQYGLASLVTASNVFAHSDKLENMLEAVFQLLKENGTFIIEVQYLMDTIKDLTFDNIYHEHTNYWTITSLSHFANKLGFTVYYVEHINTHGGSIRAYICRQGQKKIDDSIHKALEYEYKIDMYEEFGNKISKLKDTVKKNIGSLKTLGTIAAYGSPAKATTSLNYFGITSKDISFTVDDNPLKEGKFIPGVMIPIKSRQYLLENRPDIVIVLAWNFYDQICEQNQELIKLGTKFISIKDLYEPIR